MANWSNCPLWDECKDENKHIVTYCDVQCSNPAKVQKPGPADTVETEFQMDCYGNFRIVVDGQESQPAMYNSVASLTVDGKTYIGVSAYYGGLLPPETVLEVTKMESTKADAPVCNLFCPDEECTHMEVKTR